MAKLGETFAKSLEQEKWNKLLLKNASSWQIGKTLWKRHSEVFWITGFWVEMAILLWVKIG